LPYIPQVESLLGRDDDIPDLSVREGSNMPRIYQAIQLDHRQFVSHDNSQQLIRKVQLILDLVILNLVIILYLVTFLLLTNLMFIAKYDSN